MTIMCDYAGKVVTSEERRACPHIEAWGDCCECPAVAWWQDDDGRHTRPLPRENLPLELVNALPAYHREYFRAVRIAETAGELVRVIPGEAAFETHSTHGIPLHRFCEVAADRGAVVDLCGYWTCVEEHREKSRATSKLRGLNTDRRSDA